MASDLVYALCALATVGIPLGVAWLIVVLGEAGKKRRGRHHDQRSPGNPVVVCADRINSETR